MLDDHPHGIFGNGGVRVAVIGALSILALFLFAETASVTQDLGRPANPATDTITVSGEGQAALAPDIARVSFSVEHTDAAVSAAQAASTKQANATLDFVKGKGIADKDIRTLSYDISPQYSYPRPCPPGALCPAVESPTITGYRVAETIEVSVHDLALVGDLIEGLGRLGVQNVSGPAFALADPNAGRDAARARAIENARVEAALLATQLGVRLGRVVNFSESSDGFPVPLYAAAGTAASRGASAPELPPGENTYTASVSITYEIR